MADKKLNISFLWHMHQPLYKDPFNSDFILPWVLFHGTKDYYDMVAILEDFPEIHQTFNLVPSLIEQIQDYCSPDVKDRYRQVSLKKAAQLTAEDKYFILDRFFQSNWETMINPNKRYREMLKLRGFSSAPEALTPALRFFGEQDYLDLQVLFNLSWVDPMHINSDAWLAGLVKKGRGYTEEDKATLLKKQTAIMQSILPKYAEMRNRGIIDITTSPYYHPILPLLCDSDSAKEAMPGITLPARRFIHPEDAREQIRRAVVLHKETFGVLPEGMWPSEGSVSMDMAPLVAEAGIKWIGTDEEILSQSLKKPVLRSADGQCMDGFIYRPYSLATGNGELKMVFRDKVLSDLIGFEYSRQDPDKAVADFTSRLARIHQSLDDPDKHLVNIILDGENAWEYYRNDGNDFLRLLYKTLQEDERFRCVTPGEFFSSAGVEPEKIARIQSGSWIDHNFSIWIGHGEDNAAWDMISQARQALVEYEESTTAGGGERDGVAEAIEAAWEEIYAAEGSDWFWWYGDDHTTMRAEDFDYLFRAHLIKVFRLIGKEHPSHFDIPIISTVWEQRPSSMPTGFMEAIFDGEVTSYFEWLSAGKIERRHTSGAMHCEGAAPGFIGAVFFGFDLQSLFMRLDYQKGIIPFNRQWELTIKILHPEHVKVKISVKGRESSGKLFKKIKGEWQEQGELTMLASGDIVELGLDFAGLGAAPGSELKLYLELDGGEYGQVRWPAKGIIVIDVPDSDYENLHWMV